VTRAEPSAGKWLETHGSGGGFWRPHWSLRTAASPAPDANASEWGGTCPTLRARHPCNPTWPRLGIAPPLQPDVAEAGDCATPATLCGRGCGWHVPCMCHAYASGFWLREWLGSAYDAPGCAPLLARMVDGMRCGEHVASHQAQGLSRLKPNPSPNPDPKHGPKPKPEPKPEPKPKPKPKPKPEPKPKPKPKLT
jgi:cell division septation protein DedD